MFLCYILIVLSILTNVIITVLQKGDEASRVFAKRFASRIRYMIWFFGPGLFTFLFFTGTMLYVPFLCIILPVVLVLVISWLIERVRAWWAARGDPQVPDFGANTSSTMDSHSSDDEDKIPAPVAEIEMNTRDRALQGEIGKSDGRSALYQGEDSES